MAGFEENYYARYVYNAVSEFIYFVIIYIRQNGEANILNITKYLKFFKQEVNCFVESFEGATLDEKLKNMLCMSSFIFSASEEYLTLTPKHDVYKRMLFEDIITSKVMDLILKDICKINDIWNNLKLNNVFYFIDKCSLLSMLSRSAYFDVKHSNFISINQLKGVLGFDSVTYKTVISYFQSYLQYNKKISYLELKRCSFLPVCELNDALKLLCIMFCSSLFKCRKSYIKLKSKLKRSSQQKKKLDLERLFVNESACGMPIGYVIYKLHGPHLTNWTGEIGNLHQDHGLIYCVIDFIDSNEGIFCVFFSRNSLQQVSEIKDLRDYLSVRDIVEFQAEYYEGSENRFWKATKIEVVRTTFKHDLKLICDNSIEETLNNFQERGGQNGLGQNNILNSYENNKAKMKVENLNHLDLTPISYKKSVCDVQPDMCLTLKSGKQSEMETPFHRDMSFKNDQNSFIEKAFLYREENNKLKKLSSLSLPNINGINLPNEPLNEKSMTENAQNVFLQQANGSLKSSGNKTIKSDVEVLDVNSENDHHLSAVMCGLVMCSNKCDREENESYKSLLHTGSICNNIPKNVEAELKYISGENKSSKLQSNTQSMCNNKTVCDQTGLICSTGKSKEMSFCSSLSSTESICRSKTENGFVEMKYIANNSFSLEKTFFSDRESLYKNELDITSAEVVHNENSLKVISSKKESPSLSNIQKCANEIHMKISQDTDIRKQFSNKTFLAVSEDEPKTSGATYPLAINENVKKTAGEFNILSKIKENSAKKSSFLHVPNFELSNFVYMFGNVTIVTDDTGIASSVHKCNRFDVFFRFEAIYPVSNLKVVKVGQKVLLYVPYGAERSNDVLAATFVYLLSSEEAVKAEGCTLSAEKFANNLLHGVHVSDHNCNYLSLPSNRGMLIKKTSLKLNNAFLVYLHIAFQFNRTFAKKKKVCNKRNIQILSKNSSKMLPFKNTYVQEHTLINSSNSKDTVPNLINCESTAPVSPISSTKLVSPSNSSSPSKSRSSFGSCNSSLACDSYEDSNEEMYYSCDSVFSLDENLQNKGLIKETVSVVPNNTDPSNHYHSVHSFLAESKEALASECCDKLLGAEYKSSPLSDCLTVMESKQYEDFSNDCDKTDSKYAKSDKYLKLKSLPIFKRIKKKATAKSSYKYNCIKCYNSIIVKKAFVSLITESSLILNLKIKTHDVFLGYPMHLIPDDSKHRIKLNSKIKIMFIPEKILSLSHVLALDTSSIF